LQLASPPGASAQGDASARASQIIHGCVTTNAANPVPRTAISVTRAPDRHVDRDTTDARGCFQIAVSSATGDYLIGATAIGYRPFRTRVTTASDSTVTVNITLKPIPRLATVRTVAERPRLSRSRYARADEPGAGEVIADGVGAELSDGQQGDIAALTGTMPGILNTSNGASVLGLGSDQNSTTLGGMAFAGAKLPRDAEVQTHIATSTFDPSRGGFGGASVAVELRPGDIWNGAQAHLSLDAPFAQAYDPVAQRSGNRFTRIIAGAGSLGELIPDRFTYNAAIEASRRTANNVTLESLDPVTLAASGIPRDSARALLGALGDAGLPVAAVRDLAVRSTSVTLIGRVDHLPWKHHTWGVTGYASSQHDDAVGASTTATRSQLGRNWNDMVAVFAKRSDYFNGTGGLNEAKTGLTIGRRRARPSALIPQGVVLIPASNSGSADSVDQIGVAAFGGNGIPERDQQTWTWQTIDETSWLPRGGKHAVKLSLGTRLDGMTDAASPNRFGRYTYRSIADVAENRPASYSRNIDASGASSREWTGYASLGDFWYASPSLQLLYGARLDFNRYTTAPVRNAEVEHSLGIRNDHVPNTIGFSPRLGFTWIYSRTGTTSPGATVSPGGTFYTRPSGTIRGGIGLFRGGLPVGLVTQALELTGTTAGRTVSCVGAAVPIPDWSGYIDGSAAIPDACAGSEPALAQRSNSVVLFDPAYTAPESWRASLEWLPQLRWVTFSVRGTYSLNVHQPGITDLNFDGTPAFSLSDEGERPVYVPLSDVVAASGALTSNGSRRDPAFGRVISHRSDSRSIARQLIFRVSPAGSLYPFYLRASWALGDVRQFGNGFDFGTFGDPRARDWSPSMFDVRNQLQLQLSYYYQPKGISFTLYGTATSGLPYTPIIAGDVNGDGFSNDRAFIFDPGTASDETVRRGINALLQGGDERAADCLRSQLGHVAGINSCRGPWSQSLNMRLDFGNPIPDTQERMHVGLSISNAISGVDQLLHGSDNLRGWGLASVPDPVLLRVSGFDPVARQYHYDVNQRFGSSRISDIAYRNPFRVTLDVTFRLSKPIPVQQLDKWLGPGRNGRKGPRLSASALALKYSRTVPDIYRLVLEQADSLLLSADQVNALTLADEQYRPKVDSVWKAIGEYLAGLPDEVDAVEALHRVDIATTTVWQLARAESGTMRSILTPIQLRLVPYIVNLVVNTTRPLKGVQQIVAQP
jgi:hypothetical protein